MTEAKTAYVKLTRLVSRVTNVVLTLVVLVGIGVVSLAWTDLGKRDASLDLASAESSAAIQAADEAQAAVTAADARKREAWTTSRAASTANAIAYDSETAAGVANGTISVPAGGSYGFDAGLYSEYQIKEDALQKPYAASVNELEAAKKVAADADSVVQSAFSIQASAASQQERALATLIVRAAVAGGVVLVIGLLALAFAISFAKARASLSDGRGAPELE